MDSSIVQEDDVHPTKRVEISEDVAVPSTVSAMLFLTPDFMLTPQLTGNIEYAGSTQEHCFRE